VAPNKNFLVGALTLASVLLYPKTLGGGAVLSGWVPFTSSIISQFPEEAKKVPHLCFLINVDQCFCVSESSDFAICRHQSCGLMALMTEWYSLKLVKLLFLFSKKPVLPVNSRYIQIKTLFRDKCMIELQCTIIYTSKVICLSAGISWSRALDQQ